MFYEKYIAFSYDAEVKYKTAKVVVEQFPSAISYLEINEALLKSAKKSLSRLDKEFDNETKLTCDASITRNVRYRNAVKDQSDTASNTLQFSIEESLFSLNDSTPHQQRRTLLESYTWCR